MNVAVTVLAASMVTVQLVGVAVVQFVQSMTSQPASGVAVRVTVLFSAKSALQLAVHSFIPVKSEDTLPLPATTTARFMRF